MEVVEKANGGKGCSQVESRGMMRSGGILKHNVDATELVL